MTNYQYRYGGTAIDVIRALYAEGGPRRFYRGQTFMSGRILWSRGSGVFVAIGYTVY